MKAREDILVKEGSSSTGASAATEPTKATCRLEKPNSPARTSLSLPSGWESLSLRQLLAMGADLTGLAAFNDWWGIAAHELGVAGEAHLWMAKW